jgi:cytochrome c5
MTVWSYINGLINLSKLSFVGLRMKLQINTNILKKSLSVFISAGLLSVIAQPSLAAVSAGQSPGATVQAQAMQTYDANGYPIYPTPNYSKGDRKLIEKGEYLAKAGDCMACHTDTKNKGKPFAGGLGINTPFGTFYSPNITPDKETGIGKWTNEDFIRAMHDGKAPDGSNYYPVFPYPDFNKISKEDLLAIKAYIFSLPAIHQENHKNDVMFPFSWRFLQYGWKILFFYPHTGQYQYDADKSAEVNRGAYLVQGLGHCGMCHTPINLLGAPKRSYYLTGNLIEGYYAPNISKVGLKGATAHEITRVFSHDELLHGRGKVGGPMAEVNHDSLKYMSDEDLHSIASYLLTVESKQPAMASNGKVTPAEGKKIYAKYCAACHTTGSAGAPMLGDASAWDPLIKLGVDKLHHNAINGINSMPPKGGCPTCSDNQIKAAVDYLVEAAKGGTGPAIKVVRPMPKLTLADGKNIYNESCRVCHQNGDLGAPKLGDAAAWTPRIAQNMDILFTHAIEGYKGMPKMGACYKKADGKPCSQAEVMAAVKYMVQESNTGGDYSLW